MLSLLYSTELVSNITLDEDIKEAALLVAKTIKPKESEQSSQSEDEGMEEGGQDSSGSEWTEETGKNLRKFFFLYLFSMDH
jgi:hypothetical protein